MGLKNRIVEIAYRLRDDFSAKVSGVTGAFKKVDESARKSAKGFDRFAAGAKRAAATASRAFIKLRGKLGLLGASISALTFGRAIKELDQLAKTAQKLGVAVSDLDALRYAAERSGVDVSTLETAMQRLARRTAEAAQGTGEAQGAIEELGLDAQRLAQLSPDQQLLLIADAMREVGNQNDKIRLAFKLFDSGGVALVNMMQDGADGMRKLMAEVYATGNVITEQMAKSAEKSADEWTRFKDRIGRGFDQVIGSLAGGGNILLDALFGPPKSLDEAIEQTKKKLKNLQDYYDILAEPSRHTAKRELEFMRGRVESFRAQLQKLVDLQKTLDPGDEREKQRRDAEAKERAHNREMYRIRKQGTNALKKTLAERQSEYKKNLAELERLKAEEKAIAKEFEDFVKGVEKGGDGEGKKATFFNAALLRTQAQGALNKGDFETAIAKAREAKQMVEEMQATGAATRLELLGLAKSIERVANGAAKGRTTAKETNLDHMREQIRVVRAELEKLNATKIDVKFDEDALRAELQRLQQMLNNNPLDVPVKPRKSISDWNTDLRNLADAMQRSQWSDI